MNLESANLIYRPITESDTDMVLNWRNNPDIKKYFFYRKDITRQEHLNWLRNKVDKGFVIQFIVIVKKTDTPIGSVYFRDIDHETKSAEYGIFIGEKEARGKGYGLEIATRMISYFFEVLKYEKLYLQAVSSNFTAIKCYSKAGFTVSSTDSKEISNGNEKVSIDVTYMSIDRTYYTNNAENFNDNQQSFEFKV